MLIYRIIDLKYGKYDKGFKRARIVVYRIEFKRQRLKSTYFFGEFT
jgi:hypothetical protein